MSQTSACECEKAVVKIPLLGMELSLDANAFPSGTGEGGFPSVTSETFKMLDGAEKSTVALPDGGKWAWVCVHVDTHFRDAGITVSRYLTGAGVNPGGTIISPPARDYVKYQVVCMRVA